MKIYGIKAQYGKDFHWSLMEECLFVNELDAYKKCLELEQDRTKDQVIKDIFHRYEVEELEVN